MTEIEYVIAGFDKQFHMFKGKRIVLHGSRKYAEAIIDHFDSDYHFIGIMSRDPLKGDRFHGLAVLHEEDIPQMDLDIIILTERVKYEEEAYQSLLRPCEENGVLIYNMYGLEETALRREIESCRFFFLDDWEMLCRDYQMVVFETMDTLLCRDWRGQHLVMRPVFKALIPKLEQLGKEIRFSLRKSFSEEEQIEALKQAQVLQDIEAMTIRRRGEDLSFRTLKEQNAGKSILYIGMGLINECILPRYYCIDTYRYLDNIIDCNVPSRPTFSERKSTYDESLKERLMNQIAQCDLISFDIFDTLLIRRTLYPEDVFELVETEGLNRGLPMQGFSLRRAEAQQRDACPALDGIYNQMREWYGWTEETTRQICSLEIEKELEVLRPRNEMTALLDYAVEQGKQVVLTSDMYFSGEQLRMFLKKNGISGDWPVFSSCDYGKSKYTGLYEVVKSGCPVNGRMLHIGDDRAADGIECQRYGIESFVLPSPLQMAREGNWRVAVEYAETLAERCIVGMAVSELFRDPFRNPDPMEASEEERLRRFAASVIGPLTIGFLCWLVTEMEKKNSQDGVLFVSRDGWLLKQIYERIFAGRTLRPSIYFYANRHSAFLCCSEDLSLVDVVAENGLWRNLSPREIMENYYDLRIDNCPVQGEGDSLEALVAEHIGKIRENAAASREGYLCYCKQIGMMEGGRYAVVDGIASGTTQYFLSRFLPYEFQGFYMGNYKSVSAGNCNIRRYLNGDNMSLLNNFIEIESFFCSPEPALDLMSAEGSPVFQMEYRQESDIQKMLYVQKLATDFAEIYFNIFAWDGERIRPGLVEEMFAADGYHGVQRTAFDDWAKTEIRSREWDSGEDISKK